MRIAILEIGNVGSTLVRRRTETAHQITFGVRYPEKKRSEAEKLKAKVKSIAPAYVLLASSEASYVTGEVFGNTGGTSPF
jgi:predicted dinucleotide-binding enzyme